jgi:hypothetical protein
VTIKFVEAIISAAMAETEVTHSNGFESIDYSEY